MQLEEQQSQNVALPYGNKSFVYTQRQWLKHENAPQRKFAYTMAGSGNRKSLVPHLLVWTPCEPKSIELEVKPKSDFIDTTEPATSVNLREEESLAVRA